MTVSFARHGRVYTAAAQPGGLTPENARSLASSLRQAADVAEMQAKEVKVGDVFRDQHGNVYVAGRLTGYELPQLWRFPADRGPATHASREYWESDRDKRLTFVINIKFDELAA